MEAVHQADGLTLIALPYVSKDGFSGPTVRSLIGGFASGQFGKVSFIVIGDKSQVAARNEGCNAALASGADYLWFVDSDQDFQPDALTRLKAVGSDVACADMWSRGWPSFRLTLIPGEKDADGHVQYKPVPDEMATGIQPISFCGMGCTLIRTSILDKMREVYHDQPWFWTAHNGEDATFCFKVLELGGTVKCDYSVKSGHWGHCRMMGQDYTRRPHYE